jgi:outer membrane biosynthesis protein TonB
MDRAEATGFGVAVAGHALLLGILSVGFASVSRPPLIADPMEVAFVDEIGLKAALADPSTEAPAEAQAPEMGPPEEAAPAPVEAPPEPTPPPPAPKPKAVAPAPEPKPEKPAKPTPAKPAPKKAAAKKSEASARASAERARASRIGNDILKGISDPSSGKAEKPRAPVGARDLAGLVQAIRQQVKPCYVIPTGGEGSDSIQTVLRLQFRKDGSTATPPSVVEQSGITVANRGYAKQMADAAKRAVLRCSPLDLPADLYEGGWEDIEFVFNPRAMGG